MLEHEHLEQKANYLGDHQQPGTGPDIRRILLIRRQVLRFTLKTACYRHDFGYRNFRKQNSLNEVLGKKVDDNFLKNPASRAS